MRISNGTLVIVLGLEIAIALGGAFCAEAVPEEPAPSVRVSISTRQSLAGANRWKLRNAWIVGSLGGLQARVEVRNSGPDSVHLARFYGQYFDGHGRRCLTLVLIPTLSGGEPLRVWKQGQSATIASGTLFVGPATEPRQLELAQLAPAPGSSGQRPHASLGKVDSPPTLSGTGAAFPWEKVTLGPDVIGQPAGPVVDLALALVTVSNRGRREDVHLLNLRGPEVETAMENLIDHLTWRPGLRNGMAAEGTTLLLIRAVLRRGGHDPSVTWADPWVRASVSRLKAPTVPVVNEVLLNASRRSEGVHPGLRDFEYNGLGAFWSTGALNDFGHWQESLAPKRHAPSGIPTRVVH